MTQCLAVIITGGWQQVVVPAGPPSCLVSAPLAWKPSLAFPNQICSPFSVLPQYSPEDILPPSSSSQCFSKHIPKIPIRILWGAVKRADQLNQSLWWWRPGIGVSRAFSGAGGTLKGERNCTGIYASSEQGLCRIALALRVTLGQWCTADASGEFRAEVDFLGRK